MDEIRGSGTRGEHARLILDSYRRMTGKELLKLSPDEDAAQAVEQSSIVILSHDTEADPVLNYGNCMALQLWEMDWKTFTSTPSRLTAEPLEREERARFMSRVTADGYVDEYTGVRISSTGKRFYIVNATVWNLVDGDGTCRGQAAAFSDYRRL